MRGVLGVLPQPVAHPVLLVMSGLPGTGKSTLARLLADRLPACVVASDALRRTLFPEPTYTGTESRVLFDLCHRLCAELLRGGRNVVFDATNLKERHRNEANHVAAATGTRLLLVRLVASEAVVAARLAHRVSAAGNPSRGDSLAVTIGDQSDADWLVYQRMQAEEEPIRRPHIAVDSSRGLDEGLRTVLRALATKPRWQE